MSGGVSGSYLVSEIPLGLLALDADLGGKVDLVHGVLLDQPVHGLLDPLNFFLITKKIRVRYLREN